jgi:hypothetical protein
VPDLGTVHKIIPPCAPVVLRKEVSVVQVVPLAAVIPDLAWVKVGPIRNVAPPGVNVAAENGYNPELLNKPYPLADPDPSLLNTGIYHLTQIC